MKIILVSDVAALGESGDIVEVKDGYARNYLLPRGFAIPATKGAEKQVASIRRAQEARRVRDLDHAQQVRAQLQQLDTVALTKKVAKSGKLFGSITTADVVSAVREAGGPNLDKRSVTLRSGAVKTLGKHAVDVRLHPDVSASFHILVQAGS